MPPVRALASRFVPLLALATAAACARHPGARSAPVTQPESYVRVENTMPQSFTLYVLDGSSQLRMGRADPLRTTLLRIPRSLVFPAVTLRFLARPDDPTSASPVTETIVVSPGDTVGLQIVR
ncbi:MAG TPA: hypothetical protein VFS44_04885 [Gemmatimonadaceae bacterium]|nr:hypothetical protein [Gemmatimonadaceae bacterium]